mgnify:CR=1 FL=1
MSSNKKKGLGRGLSALFGDEAKKEINIEKKDTLKLAISELSRNPYQPRQIFNERKFVKKGGSALSRNEQGCLFGLNLK